MMYVGLLSKTTTVHVESMQRKSDRSRQSRLVAITLKCIFLAPIITRNHSTSALRLRIRVFDYAPRLYQWEQTTHEGME